MYNKAAEEVKINGVLKANVMEYKADERVLFFC